MKYIETRFDISLYIVLGIAGSLSADNDLGDVCYSGTVYDVTSNTAASQTDTGQTISALSPNVYHSNERMIRSLAFLRNHPATQVYFQEWQEECITWRDLLAERLLPDDPTVSLTSDTVSIHVGPIVCGPVTKSTSFKSQLLAINRKMLAIETESAAVYEFLKGTPKHENVLIIRGTCDFADSAKSTLEETTKGLVRQCAAINAALFLFYQLKCTPFINAVKALSNSLPSLPYLSVSSPSAVDQLESTIQVILNEIDERLSELSPEYRLKPNGYVLPIPRFRRDPLNAVGIDMQHSPAENITDILDQNHITWVKVDHSYPDDSLPWVIAQHLLRQELGDKFILPLVVEGSQIRPPTGTIQGQIEARQLGHVGEQHGSTLVVIIANPNLSTENSRKYLSTQIEKHPDTKFVLVTRDDFHVDDLASTLGAAGGRKYLVDKVSFQELVIFLQSAFQMDTQKAEVLAQRLDDIFSRFDLLAHPTYFAGIPEAMLNAFLQANRRSELIQLAVDGFLTFLVADDRAEVILSRTTRQQFLSIVVYDINVDLERYSKIALIQKAAKFAEEMDYEIDEARFVDDFFRKGILRDDDGRVVFALPFVERYLLALELRRRGEGAQLSYFNFDPDAFDFGTFDLFCELADDNRVVSELGRRIDKSIQHLTELYPEGQVLLSDRIAPTLLADPNSVDNLAKMIREAEGEVRRGDSKAAEKQAVLDLIDEGTKVAESKKEGGSEASEEGTSEGEEGEGGDIGRVKHGATFNYVLGCLCLGSGAERLNGRTKQELISKVLALGGLIVNGWTRDRADINAKGIEEELRASGTHQRVVEELDEEAKVAELERFVRRLAEVIELNLLREPSAYVIGIMAQYGRHPVLAQSVQAVEPGRLKDDYQRLLRGIWLTEVKTETGIRALRRTMSKARPGNFLRVILVEHLLNGVRWDHWELSIRLKLINLAYEIVRPTSVSFDKGRIERDVTSGGG